MCAFIWRSLDDTPKPSEIYFIAFADCSPLLESSHGQQFFLTNLYETATQVIHFVVLPGPSASTRTKMNFNFMRKICMCKKILLGKAGKLIILCCSSPDLQTVWNYTNMFSPVLCFVCVCVRERVHAIAANNFWVKFIRNLKT